MTHKDNRIELYRFIFSVLIMVFHAHTVNNGLGHPIPLGHVFVEFFFFLTGYFTYSHIDRKRISKDTNLDEAVYPFAYTWKKIKRMVLFMMMTAIVYYSGIAIGHFFIQHASARDIINGFSSAPFDLLLLQITGICKNPQFNSWWYLSALVFVLPLAMIVFTKEMKIGGYKWIMYLSPMIIYGYFSFDLNGLNWETRIGFVCSGFFRGMAGLCVGGIIYCLSKKLEEKRFIFFNKFALTLLEIACYIGAVMIAWRYYDITNSTFTVVFLLILGMILSFGNRTYTVYANWPLLEKLGVISTPLYICHYSVGRLSGMYLNLITDNLYWKYLTYYSASIIMSLLMIKITKIYGKWKEYEPTR